MGLTARKATLFALCQAQEVVACLVIFFDSASSITLIEALQVSGLVHFVEVVSEATLAPALNPVSKALAAPIEQLVATAFDSCQDLIEDSLNSRLQGIVWPHRSVHLILAIAP